ncbi:MAG: BLUF domain-containing protein [Bacteriovoracaceae bacterium]
MYQLFYVSNVSKDFNPHEDIKKILSVAHKTNSEQGISGILLFHGGIFLQLLEGDKEKVEKLYLKIEQDRRHSNVIKLIATEGNQRLFPDWTMAFHEVKGTDIKLVNQIMSWTHKINKAESIDNQLILSLISNFKQYLHLGDDKNQSA